MLYAVEIKTACITMRIYMRNRKYKIDCHDYYAHFVS